MIEPLMLVSALRAVVEMLGLCLLGQGALALLAGARREKNAIYRGFALVTRAPRCLTGAALRIDPDGIPAAGISFVLLGIIWVALAVAKKFL